MARVLVLYGTTDGHTRKIADALADGLRAETCDVDVVDARYVRDERPEHYDAVVVAASIHISAYQRAVRRWVRRHVNALNVRPTAFVSVCLGVLERRPEAQRAVAAIADRFLEQAGWTPDVIRTVAGALPYTRYNWFKKWMLRRIAAKAGMETDTRRDYEFTDWSAVREVSWELAGRIPGMRRARRETVPQACAVSCDIEAPRSRAPALA